MTTAGPRPPILIAEEDRQQLHKLAQSALNHIPEVADELLFELERAEFRPSPDLSADIVRMNSTVEFETDKGTRLVLQLVYPEKADIAAGRISILTPIGTALIGLSIGQTMTWVDRDGQSRQLRIVAVTGHY